MKTPQFERLLEAHIEQFHSRSAVGMDFGRKEALRDETIDDEPLYRTGEERLAWIF